MIGAVTLLTMAAVTGSRNSSGWRGPLDLQEANRLSETRMRMRFRISEVDAVADTDKQSRGVADLETRGILAQLGATFDLQHMTMPLVVNVPIRSIENRCKARIGDLPLEQEARTGSPGTKHRVARNKLPAEDVVCRRRIVPHNQLIEIVLPQ